ncbi:antA/AntB antirepressor family protein [Lactobacillus gasseri]|uniref:antA/AntB antirepressor family protein n=1 Tax=Lactobacillus gasseri TaxID=1596 RepID=UPI002737FD17|nr:antA/AntB antirepressor family protein [Lactobacillus gasseri]
MNNELIKVTVQNDQQLVSARDLYKGLEIRTRFSLWVSQNFKEFEEGADFTSVVTSTVVNNGARKEIQDYALTIDMAKQLCLLSRTQRGKEYREYLIEVEKKWNNPDMIMQRALTIASNRVKLLETENKRLEDTNAKQAAKIAKDADDVVFAKAIRYSHHAITIGELAEILTQNGFVIGRNQLFQLLRKEKYLSSFNHSWNVPMTQMVKRGLFRITHNLTKDGRGYSQTWVTPKGQKHIINKALRGKFDDTYQKVMVSTLNV